MRYIFQRPENLSNTFYHVRNAIYGHPRPLIIKTSFWRHFCHSAALYCTPVPAACSRAFMCDPEAVNITCGDSVKWIFPGRCLPMESGVYDTEGFSPLTEKLPLSHRRQDNREVLYSESSLRRSYPCRGNRAFQNFRKIRFGAGSTG